MKVLALDPGATTGWVLYDADAKRVLSSGQFRGHTHESDDDMMPSSKVVVIERPKGYHGSPGAVVDCGYVCGRIVQGFEERGVKVHEMFRHEIRAVLQEATHGTIRVKNDATAWAALKLLHGEACDKKGGSLYGVKAHERAALAVAVAWVMRKVTA